MRCPTHVSKKFTVDEAKTYVKAFASLQVLVSSIPDDASRNDAPNGMQYWLQIKSKRPKTWYGKGGFKISLSTIIGSMDGGTYDSGGKNEKKQTTEGGVFGRSINFAQRQNQSFYPSHLLFLSILVASCLWMAWNSRHTLLMELFPSLCRWTKMKCVICINARQQGTLYASKLTIHSIQGL